MADPAVERLPPPGEPDFADVPLCLTDWVRAIPPGLNERARYVMAGGLVTAHYLGSGRLEAGDPFVLAGEGTAQWQAASRLVSIAEALFVLRAQAGFVSLIDGLRGKDLRAAFFELSIARRFCEGGFVVGPLAAADAIDGFSASAGPARIDVALIGHGQSRFSAEAVRTSVVSAADAISGDAPGFLCCYHPDSWRMDCWDLDFSLSATAREVLTRQGKINRIGFYREEFAACAGGAAHSLAGFTERNADPAHPSPALDALLDRQPMLAPPRTGTAHESTGPGGGIAPLSFFQWIDWALASRP